MRTMKCGPEASTSNHITNSVNLRVEISRYQPIGNTSQKRNRRMGRVGQKTGRNKSESINATEVWNTFLWKTKLCLQKHLTSIACGCKMDCTKKITAEKQAEIHKTLYCLGNWSLQTTYFLGLIKVTKVKHTTQMVRTVDASLPDHIIYLQIMERKLSFAKSSFKAHCNWATVSCQNKKAGISWSR